MEEQADERCNVVYFCASANDHVSALYHHKSPPKAAAGTRHQHDSLEAIYHNAQILLDEDQGGFNEVFLSSCRETCMARLDACANSAATVVLVEVIHPSNHSKAVPDGRNAHSFHFLRTLAADIQGARYQKQVILFAVIVTHPPEPDVTLDAATTASCLSVGATEVLRSAFNHEDINRLVGHVKEQTRLPARLLAASMAQNLVDSIRSVEPVSSRHRPDKTVSRRRQQLVEKAIADWYFPAHEFNMDELTCAVLFMLEQRLRSPALEAYSLPRAELMSFLLATRRQYKHEREVYYHNWRHAVDVTQSVYKFLLKAGVFPPEDPKSEGPSDKPGVESLLTPLDGLILLISAIGHDVGHPGVNNGFLVACNHPLAQVYNDKSVLENYHCAAYSQLLRRHWPSLSTIPGFRASLVSNILATDMQRHFEYMSNLGDLRQKVSNSGPEFSEWSERDKDNTRELIMALLMKAADISNVARPFDLSACWAKILMNEFSRQGELENELQIPTCLFGGPPNKKDTLAAAQSQKGFMDLFGFPLFSGMANVMPSMACALRQMESNQATWEERIQREKERRESGEENAPLTFSSVSKDEVEQAQKMHHQSNPAVVPALAAQPPSTPTKRQTVLVEPSPDRHPAASEKRHLTFGAGPKDEHRPSTPFLGTDAIPLSPTGAISRRSSKDIALDQLQQLSTFSGPALSPGSRRGSADANLQINQSFPSSRRGSKDESLTTILVTSQGGSPGRRTSPGHSSGKAATANGSASPGKSHGGGAMRQSIPRSGQHQHQQGSATRSSIPSSRSHATSSATATTTNQHSPTASTRPSSLSPTDDDEEATPPAHHTSIAATEDPFQIPGNWPNDLDGTHRASPPNVLSNMSPQLLSPPTGAESAKTEATPRQGARMASGDSEGRSTPSKSEVGSGLRESRSRSRLRGLKFWKKKRDVSGVESGPEGGSP